MLSPGQSLTLTIEKPAAGGRMIARHDGQVILVGGAIPGERVRACVERSTRKAWCTPRRSRSTSRRPIGGRGMVTSQCGGCLYAHIAYARQLDIKAAVIADAFARIGRIALPAPPQIVPSPEAGYRMRARLHVRGGSSDSFARARTTCATPRQTRQLLPATCDVVERVGGRDSIARSRSDP